MFSYHRDHRSMSRSRRMTALFLCLVFLLGSLAGCGSAGGEIGIVTETAEETAAVRYKEDVVTTYAMPERSSFVRVNTVGYMTDGSKMVWFDGARAVEDFEVLDAETGLSMGTYKSYVDENGLTCGNFTAMDTPGTYRIHSDAVGYSETFTVSDNPYEDYIPELYTALEEGATDYETILILLEIYEWDEDHCGDDYGLRFSGNNLPDILDLVKSMIDRAPEETTVLNRALKACALAQFAYFFKDYDSKSAAAYTEEAEELLKQASGENLTDREAAAVYDAQCILYRTTERGNYKNAFCEYLKNNFKGIKNEPLEFFGNMTYLNKRGEYTPTSYMTTLRRDMEDVAVLPMRENVCLRAGMDVTEEEYMYNMLYLCFFSCISPSYAYQEYLLAGLDYYLGVNETGENLAVNEAYAPDPRMQAVMLFMIYELTED